MGAIESFVTFHVTAQYALVIISPSAVLVRFKF